MILIPTLDDINTPNWGETTKYLKKNKIPVTVFPHAHALRDRLKATVHALDTITTLEWGHHGIRNLNFDGTVYQLKRQGKIVNQPIVKVAAWPNGAYVEGNLLQKYKDKFRAIRGTSGDGDMTLGDINRYNVPSLSLGHNQFNDPDSDESIRLAEVIKQKGVLVVHLHDDDGLDALKYLFDHPNNNKNKPPKKKTFTVKKFSEVFN